MLLLFITYGLYLVSTKRFASFSEKPVCNYFFLLHTSQTIVLTKVRNKKAEHPTTTHLHSSLSLRNPILVHPAHRKLGFLQGHYEAPQILTEDKIIKPVHTLLMLACKHTTKTAPL